MEILIKPIITEKMTSITEKKSNCFGFIVHKKANKIQIKKAIEAMYSVTVKSVNTVNYAGKVKTRNTKAGLSVGRVPAFKKAFVSLEKGETIDLYSNI